MFLVYSSELHSLNGSGRLAKISHICFGSENLLYLIPCVGHI
jgi:hypothetical protein